jgi:uncharacterized protein (TIGR02996 family)
MNEEAAFIAALVKEPSDKTVALVFADWLDEHGDPRGPMMRIDAVRAWMAPKYTNPLPEMLAALQSGKRVMEASKALALIGEAALPGLVALLSHKTSVVRVRAVKSISLMGARAQSAIPNLLTLAKDKERDVRKHAIRAAKDIYAVGNKDTSVLTQALGDRDKRVRDLAKYLHGPTRAKKVVKTDLAKGLDSRSANKRLATVQATNRLSSKTAITALCKALADPDVSVRVAAADRFRARANPKMTVAIEPLRKALADRSPEVRYSVVRVLEKIGPAAVAALPDLLSLLARAKDKERSHVLDTIAKIGVGRPEVLEVVLAALSDIDTNMQYVARRTLPRWPSLPTSATPVLLKFLCSSKDSSDRTTSALYALTRITPLPPEVLKEFRTRLARKGERSIVIRALGSMGAPAAPLLPELSEAFFKLNPGAWGEAGEIAKALGRIGGKGIEALVRALDHKAGGDGAALHQSAAEGLRAAGPTALPVLPALLARLRKPMSWRLRQRLLQAIGAMGPGAESAIPELIAMLNDELTEAEIESALEALEGVGPAAVQAVPKLTKLLHQRTHAAAHAPIIRFLVRLQQHGADVFPVLCDVLRQANAGSMYRGTDTDAREVAIAVIYGLAAQGPAAASAMPDLERAYRTFTGYDGVDILAAFGKIGGAAVPILRNELTDSAWYIRQAAVKALGTTGDTSADTITALRALETDASGKVRRRAVAVLQKIAATKAKKK